MLFVFFLAMLLSFYLLAKVCDEYFIISLDKISKKLKLTHEAAGATLMAVGSSAPELFVSLIAILKPGNHGALGAGTIVGSAIFNILVIIGGSLLVRRAYIVWQPVFRDLFFYVVSVAILLITFWDGKITLSEVIIFIVWYIIYVFSVINWKKIFKYRNDLFEQNSKHSKKTEKKFIGKVTNFFDWLISKTFPEKKHYISIFIISLFWIGGLSWLLVESAVFLAHSFGIPEVIIGLTILAAGTSIPDLISSLIVAKQGRSGMAISNAIGSNIFDILIGLGMPWLLAIIFFGRTIVVDNTNLISSIILLFATVICISFLFIVRRFKLGKKSGLFLIGLYLAYIIWLIVNNYIK